MTTKNFFKTVFIQQRFTNTPTFWSALSSSVGAGGVQGLAQEHLSGSNEGGASISFSLSLVCLIVRISVSIFSHKHTTHWLFLIEFCISYFCLRESQWYAKDPLLTCSYKEDNCTQDILSSQINDFAFLWSWFRAHTVLSFCCYFCAQPGVKTHLTFQILLCYKVVNNSDMEETEHVYQKSELLMSLPRVERTLWHYWK